MPTTSSTPGISAGRPKATLFCPACDHESPIDGDWVLADHPTGTAYDCPSCEATVTVRPTFDESDGRSGRAGLAFAPLAAWSGYLRAVQRAASSWYPSL
ncbi:hypothetical protein [Haloarchaeobius sp. HME9146]|uniref:hypothetical protein n=1 Tax=Haloarchaeobius sp. HME9146 TaxID=2978732 RepID=UPI0021C009D2|nr:hypothetical protein [Haloarchaeobius sp. HME9146]MCT9095182.1 hypothetical protein [Haloarchaeobius sp. HME9146]